MPHLHKPDGKAGTRSACLSGQGSGLPRQSCVHGRNKTGALRP